MEPFPDYGKGSFGMGKKYFLIVFLGILLIFLPGCSLSGVVGINTSQTESIAPGAAGTEMPPEIIGSPTATSSTTSTITFTPTPTEVVFAVGKELTIDYLRELEIIGSEITFEQELGRRSNYQEHLVSYISEGNKIYGLLTIPYGDPPEEGYKAIVFNHGYIPPAN
ncbi:MAG: hypothetical protein MUP11_03615, partial [Anaerolineales bacterium]|nr:hypothetical protein [Anaerolineales bacterium]